MIILLYRKCHSSVFCPCGWQWVWWCTVVILLLLSALWCFAYLVCYLLVIWVRVCLIAFY